MPSVITHNIAIASVNAANNSSAAVGIAREQAQIANQKSTQESIQNVAVKVSINRRRDSKAPVQSPPRVEGGYGPRQTKSRASRVEDSASQQITDADSALDPVKLR